ncbi:MULTISPECIES: hypothetical protein [unclassified Campylobacter]|nr:MULTISPECIES: hypothetical protein [unclassified Campylobacter]MBZ7976188.1 hypothetical protein [Campylobacter sp. RM12637]MBZ7977618.1 hypothetical protein [Campylobacter sp. RM12654]MBZ7979234.1 hypothetical protein [Campylobacter sp. RM12642]MBZ7981235.1 hypothetical protein [Campylobacter sp. RM12640]MBZ7983368.1 hypothetical protein [Campylobacter sp. RM12647]MBZ7988961.1 hypothetical protein [Campylobacter sp. RM12635]MBZ7990849.1 hypothetical protein [Campylobacter sp. RM9331]MBZ
MITEKERIELDMIFNSIRTSKKNIIKRYLKNICKKLLYPRKKQYNHQFN